MNTSDDPGGTPPATPDNVVEKLAATFTMEYLTGHYRLLRDDEQRSFDQLRVTMLAFFAESCKALRAEVARLTQGLDEADACLCDANSLTEQHIERIEATEARLAALERMRTHCERCGADYVATGIEAGCPCLIHARLAALTNKIAAYEARPWPGCRMLSLGDACDCSLCQSEHKLAALTAALEEVEQEIANTFPVDGAVTRETLREWADRLAALRTPEGK